MKYIKSYEQQLSLFPEDDARIERELKGKKRRELVNYLKEKELLDVKKFKNLPFHVNYHFYTIGLLSKKKFTSLYDDLEVYNDNFVMVIDDWDDISKNMFNENGDAYLKILSGENDFFYGYSGSDYQFSFRYNWKDLTEKTLNVIKEHIIGIDFFDDDDNEFTIKEEDVVITDDLYFINGDVKIKVSKLIEDNDSFEDIKMQMNNANADSQRNADENDAFESILSDIEKVFGEVVRNNGESLWHDSKIYFDIDLASICDMDEKYFEYNGVDNANTCNTIMGLFEMEYKEFVDDYGINTSEPYNGWSGDIDKIDLNDYVVENLENNL